MMMSSCQMNSSMMNNVSRTQNPSSQATNQVKVYNPAGSASQNAPAQAQIGLNLNQLA